MDTIKARKIVSERPEKPRGYGAQIVTIIFIVLPKSFSTFYTSLSRTQKCITLIIGIELSGFCAFLAIIVTTFCFQNYKSSSRNDKKTRSFAERVYFRKNAL